MSSLADLTPGTLLFGPIHGAAGALVAAGQTLLAAAEPGMIWRQGLSKWFRIRHVGVVVEAGTHHEGPTVYDRTMGRYFPAIVPELRQDSVALTYYPTGVITAPRLVQAMAGGTEEIEMTPERHWTPEYVYLRPAYGLKQIGDPLDLATVAQATLVARAARKYMGTPYDFATYAAIPAYRRGLRTRFIKNIIAGTDTMMCSRLADAALRDAGWHAFDDGRLPGDVTPSELYRAVLRSPGVTVIRPGEDPVTLS